MTPPLFSSDSLLRPAVSTRLCTHDPRTRIMHVPSSFNVRDLGGIPTLDGRRIRKGAIIRGEAPALFDQEGIDSLLTYGVRHVLDLRSDTERDVEGHGFLQEHVDSGLVHLHAVSLVPDEGWSVDPVGLDPDADVAGQYIKYLDVGAQRLTAALTQAMTDAAGRSQAVYVHCAVGKDRTGTVIATLLSALGACPDAIADDYALTAELFHPVVAKLGRSVTYSRDLANPNWSLITPRRDVMVSWLERMDARGGPASWLYENGISPEQVAWWRNRLTV